ncbi:chaperone CupB2 [Cupriavidus basilensis OR16]|uniref:Chaperone CupB2 n=1 Tax=Cupriavidus basilensis OR16 TaxID=1127483 RepID=H1S7J5_9BURK|nr:fimbria/pilus periplasmic chaperone [Cupriavidus basilensis]EHP41409.1 chaperone CupB2 [Cupriavidus basilensis OR16]
MVSAMRSARSVFFAGAMALALSAGPAWAGLIIQGTRVIYPAAAREASVQIRNTGSLPVLMQSWIDDGRLELTPEQVKVPFTVSPAVGRVDPDNGAVLRIVYMQEPLPTDRESVFWLNVVEVPARPKDEENVLQLSYRTRIKIFFRPKNLGGDADSAPDKLTWEIASRQDVSSIDAGNATGGGANNLLEVINPTPYYVSFGDVEIKVDGKFISAGNGMVAPFGRETFAVAGGILEKKKPAAVRYEIINDYGGRRVIEKVLAK